MTIQEFEEKQEAYKELQNAKKEYEKSKELLECVKDPSWQEHASILNVRRAFEDIIRQSVESDACTMENTGRVVFDMLTNLATMVCQLEEKRYKQLLTEFEK